MVADPTGRFNIGESFKPKPEEAIIVETDADKHCQICNISVTSQPQMKLHLEGSKHAKKLKALGTKIYSCP